MYTSTFVETLIFERIRQWWAQNVVADDPAPEYTYLDRLDGLQRGNNAEHERNNDGAPH